MGVANIPAYLGEKTYERQFLNVTGMHRSTIQEIVRRECGGVHVDEGLVDRFIQHLEGELVSVEKHKRAVYDGIAKSIVDFYEDDVLFDTSLGGLVSEFVRNDAQRTMEGCGK